MKHLLLFTILSSLSLGLFAQEGNDQMDRAAELMKSTQAEPKDRLVVGISHDNWMHDIADLKTKWYSRGFDIAYIQEFQINESPLSFGIGLGFSTSNVFHNAQLVRDTNDAIRFDFSDSATFDDVYKKNKLSMNYLEIPVELRLKSKPSKKGNRFKFALGFKTGLRVDAHTKQVIELANEETQVLKTKRFAQTAQLRYGPSVRIGYGPINVNAFYSLNPLFKANEGPEIQQWSIGITFNGL